MNSNYAKQLLDMPAPSAGKPTAAGNVEPTRNKKGMPRMKRFAMNVGLVVVVGVMSSGCAALSVRCEGADAGFSFPPPKGSPIEDGAFRATRANFTTHTPAWHLEHLQGDNYLWGSQCHWCLDLAVSLVTDTLFLPFDIAESLGKDDDEGETAK